MSDEQKKTPQETQKESDPKIKDLTPDKDPSGGKRHPKYPSE